MKNMRGLRVRSHNTFRSKLKTRCSRLKEEDLDPKTCSEKFNHKFSKPLEAT